MRHRFTRALDISPGKVLVQYAAHSSRHAEMTLPTLLELGALSSCGLSQAPFSILSQYV